ncbi:hypothetical protein LBW89_25885, partial [Paenibacillus sp. alder61]|uniref:hypothetical protein n=1 Tax=Paenibacillus sp. alder61 TaxID=2862948 RepID=UPI001CD64337
VKVTKTLSLNNFIVRLASLGAVWQQGVIPQEQTTRWTGGYDFVGRAHGLAGSSTTLLQIYDYETGSDFSPATAGGRALMKPGGRPERISKDNL